MNTRNLLRLLAFVPAGLFALAACSSTEEDKFASSDSFCSSKAETLCNNLALKCGATAGACKSKQTSVCQQAAAAAQAMGRSYAKDAVQPCLDKLNEVYADQAIHATPQTEADAAEVCDRVFRGSKGPMVPCANTFECSGSLICDGVCAEKQIVGLMGGCGNAGQVCDDSTYCQPLGGKNFCVAKKADGEICGAMDPCVSTERCVGHCTAKVTVNQPCGGQGRSQEDSDTDCADQAPYCDLTVTPHVCRTKYDSRNPACQPFIGP